jgi:hypothetical protein
MDSNRSMSRLPEERLVPRLHGFREETIAEVRVAHVTRFSLRLDPETRNMRTEIDLPNPKERLYPGTYAEVSLEMN